MGTKISELTTLASGDLAVNDAFVVVDTDQGETKQIAAQDIVDAIATDFVQGLWSAANDAAYLTAIGLDTDLLTLSLPANTTISAFGKTIIDDANAAAVIATLGLDTDLLTASLPANTTISSFIKELLDDSDSDTALETLEHYHVVDSTESDQGAAGSGHSLKDILDGLGAATDYATVVFRNVPGQSSTTYDLDTTYDASSFVNVRFVFEQGAQIDGVTGDETLTIYSPANIIAADNQQIFGSSITVSFSANTGEVTPFWKGAVGDGSTEDYAAFSWAVGTGCDVYIPDSGSTFKISSKITLPSVTRQRIYGDAGTEIDFYGNATNYCLFDIYDFNIIENLIINIKNSNTNAIDSPNGISHSQFRRLKINGTGYGNGQGGIVIRGAEKDAGTANNNQYDNLIELCDFGANAAGNGVAQPVYLYGVAAAGKRCNVNRILHNRFSNYDKAIELVGDGNLIMGNDFNIPRGGTAGGKYLDLTCEQTHSETTIIANYFDLSAGYTDGIDIQAGTSARAISFVSNVLAEATINNLSSYSYFWSNAYQLRVSQVIPEENGMLMMPVYDRLGTQASRLVKQESDGDYISVIVGGTNLSKGSAFIVSNTSFDANVGNTSKAVDAGGGAGVVLQSGKTLRITEYGAGPDFTKVATIGASISQVGSNLVRNTDKGEPGLGNQILTAAMLLGGLVDEDPEGAANWTTDTAANIVDAIDNAAVGDTFECILMNDATAASGEVVTIVAGNGVTLHGSTVTLTEGTNETAKLVFRLTNVTAASEAVDCYIFTGI